MHGLCMCCARVSQLIPVCVQQLQGAVTVLCGIDQGIHLDWVGCMEAQSCGLFRVTGSWP